MVIKGSLKIWIRYILNFFFMNRRGEGRYARSNPGRMASIKLTVGDLAIRARTVETLAAGFVRFIELRLAMEIFEILFREILT